MIYPINRSRRTIAVTLLAGLVALPAAASDDADFAAMTSRQAKLDSSAATAPAKAEDVATAEAAEVAAARLGVMTPYGQRALDKEQVNELVALFVETGDLNQVLMQMDSM